MILEDGEIATSNKARFARVGIAPQKRFIEAKEREFHGLTTYGMHDEYRRACDVRNALQSCVIRHHEMPFDVDVAARAREGVDIFIDYFTGKWLAGFEPEEGVRLRCVDRHALPDSWMEVYKNGLVLCAITKRNDALRMCSRAVGHLRITESTKACFGFTVPDVAILLLLANEFTPRMKGSVEECLDAIKNCRTERPKRLAQAIVAASMNDKEQFDANFHWLMKDYIASKSWKKPSVHDWVARFESFLYFLAALRGLKAPVLSERESDFIITSATAF